MTRFILLSSFFLAMILMASFSASTGTNKSSTVTVSNTIGTVSASASEPMPQFPATRKVPPMAPEEKAPTPKIDELPHVHHFHKERVKKVKRHHKKIWTISMLILVLCHISILVMAYMHVAPH